MHFAVSRAASLAVVAFFSTLPITAHANDANFQYSGARQKALSGAGVADGADATSIALNPAGLVHSPNEYSASATLLHPLRGYEGAGDPGFTQSGEIASDREYFLIPNLAYARRVSGSPFADVIGVSVYGNGGLNTTYRGDQPGSIGCGAIPGSPGTGPYCFGKTSINLEQTFVSVGVAKTIAPSLSIGVAPILALQKVKVLGLQAFTIASVDPANVTNNGNDYAFGGGVRGGVEYAISPSVRLAAAASSRIYSEEFEEYRGAFAERGSLDVPATVQAGIAVDVTPQLTLLFDYKHIFYNDVASYHNPSTALFPLGSDGGPGFGWSDIDVFKFGLEWNASEHLTVRAGYSYNNDVVGSRDVLFNVLAPATTNHTISAGLAYALTENFTLELAGAYVLRDTLLGFEPATQGNPAHSIELYLEQYEFTAGFKYKFGAEEHASLK